MYSERKEDLSILKFVKDAFADTPFVNVVSEFPLTELTAPTISVTAGPINYELLEVGSKDMVERRVWYIDVFTVDKSQRDEFCYRLSEKFRKEQVKVYNFDEGFDNPQTEEYCLELESLSIDFLPTMLKDRTGISHRAFLTVALTPTRI